MLRRLSWYVLFLVAACGREGSSAGNTTLVTVFDSTADTLFARVNGEVPAEAVRHLVAEMQIAPGVDDTTLFTRVFEFDVDRSGRSWVFDIGSASIFVFGADGGLVRRIGRKGAGPGEFRQNGGMVVLPDQRLAMWDSQNARISFFDSAGTFQTSWPLSGGFSTSNGLYTDNSGTLYLRRPVTAPREGEILGRMGLVRLGDGGAFVDSLAAPDLPVPREVYVASNEGSRSSRSSTFAPQYHWAWTPDGEFVVAHGGRYEVTVARKNGKPLAIRRNFASVPIEAAERDYEEKSIVGNMRNVDPNWRFTGPPIPTTKAPLMALFVARDGRIWVRVAVPSEPLSENEIETPSDSTAPIQRHRTPAVYEVFNPDGQFLGRVAFPSKARLMEADGNQVWGLDEDENGLPAVTRWRIEPGL